VFVCNGNAPTMNQTKMFAEEPYSPGGGASYAIGGTSNIHEFTNTAGTTRVMAGVHIIGAAPPLNPVYVYPSWQKV
jgi:hypothetical protein